MGIFIDLTGKKFGLLTISKRTAAVNKKVRWDCICECGNLTNVSSGDLISGHTRSCGCLYNRTGRESPRFRGFQEISGRFWYSILHGAKQRNISVELSIEDAWNLFIKQNRRCALTNLILKFNKNCVDNTGTASLDRIDSSKGYSIDNCQWVHKSVNVLKWDKTQQELIDWCYKIVENNPRPIGYQTTKEPIH